MVSDKLEKLSLAKFNRQLILSLIESKEPISKSRIIEITKIRPATVISIVNSLMKEGLVCKSGFGKSTGGRKPLLLKIKPEGGYVIGVYVEKGNANAAIVDLKGKIHEKIEARNILSKDRDFFLNRITKIIRRLLMKTDTVRKKKVLGIGLAVPGLVDRNNGRWVFSANVPWCNDVAVSRILQEKFNMPVKLENDTRCLTMAEKWYGAAKNTNDFLYIDTGEGIAVGIVMNNRLYSGAGGNAGELGHATIDANGELCSCGNRGCLETIVSQKAMVKRARDLKKKGVRTSLKNFTTSNSSVRAMIKHAMNGDPLCRCVVQETSAYLGIGIANIVNILNPGIVIIGGLLAEGGDIVLDAVKKEIGERALPKSSKDADISLAKSDAAKGPRGAAILILQDMFRKL